MRQAQGLFSERIPWAWLLAIAAVLLYIPFIGGVSLFDWDEINFAEISREMMMTGDYLNTQINYKPFFEKPPLYFWLQVLSMKTFGINEFAARLPNALAGIIVLVLLFKIGSRWIDRRFGLFWALSYMGSILPSLYHKSGIIDPWFNLFIFSAIVAWIEGTRSTTSAVKWFFISGLLSGLAVLTKGPVGPLLIGLTVLVMRIWGRDKKMLSISNVMLFVVGNTIIAGLWFGMNWFSNGPDFIMAFLKYQADLLTKSVAGHKGFPGYHFVVVLFGVFPASLFAISAFRKKVSEEPQDQYALRQLMIIITLVVLLLFSIVQSKIVHYSSLAYYPLSFLSAWTICRYLDGVLKWKGWHKTLAIVVICIIVLPLFILPSAGQHIEWLKNNFTFDAFTKGSLEAEVNWSVLDYTPFIWFVGTIALALFLIRKSKKEFAFIALFTGMGIFVPLALIFFIGKIERYSQHAAVEFCQIVEGKQVEVKTIGFKSYIPYFYAKKPLPDTTIAPEAMENLYILRADKRKKLEEHPDLRILYEKNGFIFLGQK